MELEWTGAAFDRLALAARSAALATGRPTVLAFDSTARILSAWTLPVETAVDTSDNPVPGPILLPGARPRADAFTVPEAVGLTLTGVAGGPSGSRGAFGSSANGDRAAIVFLPDGTSTGGLVT